MANLRYAVKSGHRGGKKNSSRNKRKGEDGEVDARDLIDLFDKRGGGIVRDLVGGVPEERKEELEEKDNEKEMYQGDKFIWAQNILVDKLAICRLGAVESKDEIWGLEYPPVAFRPFWFE